MRFYTKRERAEFSLAIGLLIAVTAALLSAVHTSGLRDGVAERVVRLHILAASDDPRDQQLKLLVRDRLLADYFPSYDPPADAAQAADMLRADLDVIARTARDELDKNGCGEQVTVSVETSVFPRREYGGITLPAGEYTALKVVIGGGGGQNWWCVMFPPLCLGGSVRDDGSFREVSGLNGGQWRLVTNENSRVSVRFRLLDILAGIFR